MLQNSEFQENLNNLSIVETKTTIFVSIGEIETTIKALETEINISEIAINVLNKDLSEKNKQLLALQELKKQTK